MSARFSMPTNLRARTHTRLLFSAATSLALIATGNQYAVAQDADASDDIFTELEEVIVTGTRIARDPNLAAPAPVSVVSGADLAIAGDTDVVEVLKDVPSLLTSTSSQGSVDGIFAPSTGASVLQLRGLGAERTLVLVNGRRHVGGVGGTSTVDVGSIPAMLIEQVEVLTGGASAVYGADAVTGVVNFKLKNDFEGLEFDAQTGISGQGDAINFDLNVAYGQNFNDGRGNVTVTAGYTKRQGISFGDRDQFRDNGIFDNAPNPDTSDGAPTRAILSDPRFSISSALGLIVPADFSDPGLDLDGNGVSDCQQSTVGQNIVFGVAGCWVTNDDGSVRPYQDGTVASFTRQFGGDGIANTFNEDFLIPDDERYVINLLSRYEMTDNLNVFLEGKYAFQSTDFGGPLNTFYDLLTIAPDNPFTPAELQGVSNASGGLLVSRDPTDLGPNIDTNERETFRVVLGIDGQFDNGWTYELSGNYGLYKGKFINNNRVILDRFFAAVDVVSDANGNPVCRSEVDGSAPPTTPFDIPLFDSGFFTFNPGDGSCVPINILQGQNSISAEGVEWITTTTINNTRLEQKVISGFVAGDMEGLFSLPGGEVAWVLGGEYREEDSFSKFDPLARGVLPVTTPDGNAGQRIRDLDNFRQNSLVFDPASLLSNQGGGFNVKEVFGEIQLPIFTDEAFAKELLLKAAGRYADYSTIGTAFTWTVNGVWAPIDDISFRASYSQAIRAPNIDELFEPETGAFFRPVDPCDQSEIDALIATDASLGANREANCRADGIPEGYVDPLTARFTGVTSGNEGLFEETATTYTLGAIFQPSFIDGLTVSVDYWNIKIEDAISSVSAQDIVDNCYDSSSLDNQYCPNFSRNRDTTSPQFLGFNFLRQSELNFANLETAGIDFMARYAFDIDENQFTITAAGTWVDKLDRFFDPGDPTNVDPELRELQRPEWAGSISANWTRGPFSLTWQTRYMSEQALRSVEIETIDERFGPAGMADEVFIHDVNFTYEVNEQLVIRGGVNNIADKNPFITEQAFPVSPIGRYFFMGVNVKL